MLRLLLLLLLLLVLVRMLVLLLLGAPLSGLDGFALHRARPGRLVELEVEAACITNGFLVLVAAPERGHHGLTVGASHSGAPIGLLGNIARRF